MTRLTARCTPVSRSRPARLSAPAWLRLTLATVLLLGPSSGHADGDDSKPGPPRADRSRRALRVLSWNLHGVPLIETRRALRFTAMPAAVVALEQRRDPSAPSTAAAPIDILALQEIWLDGDAETLAAAFRAAGWPHARRAPAGGLLTVARGAITEARFTAFEYPGKPLKPWHADWFGGKGFDRMQIATAVGPVDFINTHLQARFGSTEYDAFQLSQAIQLGAAIGPTPGPTLPLLAAGDFNSRPGHASTDTLLAMTGLNVTGEGMNIDLVLTRPGGGRAPTGRARHVLTEPKELPEGPSEPLSDHPGVLATLNLAAGSPATPDSPKKAKLRPEQRDEARAILTGARDSVRRDRRLTVLILTILVTALGLLLKRQTSRRRRAALLAITLPGLALLLVQLLVDQPATLAALDLALQRLGT